MKALIVIDMQNDFMPGGSLAVERADTMIDFINQKMQEYPFVIATIDDHPSDHISFASTHKKVVGEFIQVDNHLQMLWPPHCVHGTKGYELHPKLLKKEIDFIIQKGTDKLIDSYSAFFDNQRKNTTNLDTVLKKAGVLELDVVGVATEYCVKYTVLDALSLGYKVVVYKSGCKGITPNGEKEAYIEMQNKGAILID